MSKTYTATKILAYLAFFQILGIKELLNTPDAQHAFSWILLGTEAIFLSLMTIHLLLARSGRVRMQNQFHKGAPKLLTITNIALLFILGAITGAAYASHYLFIPLAITSAGIFCLTIALFRANRLAWYKQNILHP